MNAQHATRNSQMMAKAYSEAKQLLELIKAEEAAATAATPSGKAAKCIFG